VYYQKHRDELLAAKAEYRKNHLDKFRAYNRKYYYSKLRARRIKERRRHKRN
jgi:hypothetical protein